MRAACSSAVYGTPMAETSRPEDHDLPSPRATEHPHGLLHLLGYNHECDRGEMRQKEKEIIETYSLPSSLIVRTAD